MRDRVYLAKYKENWVDDPNTPGGCACNHVFEEDEVVALYPLQDESTDEIDARELICMTCHFWISHHSLEEMGR
jgi:hypothetical protein